MRTSRISLSAAVACMMLLAPAQLSAAPLPEDVKSVEACIAAQSETPETCVGKLAEACRDGSPSVQSTPGITDCNARERVVWEAMIEAEAARLAKGAIGKTVAETWNRPAAAPRRAQVTGSVIVTEMQQAWRQSAVLKCDVESLQGEGGSFGRILYASCLMRESGRHALWLRALREESESR
jgi:uncharacterized protein YecT (DUF1311 family)